MTVAPPGVSGDTATDAPPGVDQLKGELDAGGLESWAAHGEEVQLPGEGQSHVGHEGDVVVGVGEGVSQARVVRRRARPLVAVAGGALAATEKKRSGVK